MVEVCFYMPSSEVPDGLTLEVLSRDKNTGPRGCWGPVTSSSTLHSGFVCGQDEALSQYMFGYRLLGP